MRFLLTSCVFLLFSAVCVFPQSQIVQREQGFCVGETPADDKSNEITAIPELLRSLNIKGHIVTADAWKYGNTGRQPT
jgi:hypothetical protein